MRTVRFMLFFGLALVFFYGACPACGAAVSGERASVVAGTWYPGNRAALKAQINDFLTQARPLVSSGALLGLVVPHAGYVYSGPVAAYAYKLLQGRRFDTAVIIGPSHRAAFSYVSVYDKGGYRTPLGLAELDREFIAALKKRDPGLRYVPETHKREHSVEIQVPFLQMVQPQCRIVPLVMGSQNNAACNALAHALAETIRAFQGKKRVLLVASSDLSHYHDAATAGKLDGKIVAALNALDAEKLLGCLANRSCEACGGGPVLAVMRASQALGANKGRVLRYATSGDVTGDNTRVVGYLAAAITKTTQNAEEKMSETTQRVSPADRRLLHTIVREAIKAKLENKAYALPEISSPLLLEPGAAFVTLQKNGQLRGCIGYIIARKPLAEAVAEMACAAAFNDPRFPPLQKEEYEELEYEISVLSPLERIADPQQVKVGTHGLLLRRGGHSGLLLPQVPLEYGWDREEFLRHTCRKAGMPMDCWQDKATEIYVFSAEVF